MNISEAFKREMDKQGISQSDLARNLLTSRQYINNRLRHWETNKLTNIKTLKKWSKGMGVDYKKFLKYL